MPHSVRVVTLCFLAPSLFCGNITYQVSPNPSVCHEVYLGRLSVPREPASRQRVSTGFCQPEIRRSNESELYLTVACEFLREVKESWVPCLEKYAVDLSQPNRVRRIDEKTWLSGTLIFNILNKHTLPSSPQAPGIIERGRVLARSGPKWSGVGAGPVDARFNEDMTKIAVNSWDGFDIEYNPLDPTVLFQSDKVRGNFWIDIYDIDSGERLLQIMGSFKKVGPRGFQWLSSWHGTRYFVVPVGGGYLGEMSDWRRLLVCDADAAARINSGGLKERK